MGARRGRGDEGVVEGAGEAGEGVERTVVEDREVGACDALGGGELRGDAGAGLLFGKAAGAEADDAFGEGAGLDGGGGVPAVVPARVEEQGDLGDAEADARGGRGGPPGEKLCADEGVQDGFEAEPGVGFGEHLPGERGAVGRPVPVEELGAERLRNRRRGLAAGCVERADDLVRIDDLRAERSKEGPEPTFAAGDAARQGKGLHAVVRCGVAF